MAAAATTAPPGIDLKRHDDFPIRIGNTLTEPTPAKRFASLRYNHKPTLPHPQDASAHLQPHPNGESDQSTLTLREPGTANEWTYDGRAAELGDTYVLCVRPGAASGKQELVLERVGANYAFNLCGTPAERDAEAVRAQFPFLPLRDEGEDDLFGKEEEAEVDARNAFDWRNHLVKKVPEKGKAIAAAPPRSTPSSQQAKAANPSALSKAAPTTSKSAATASSSRPAQPAIATKKRKPASPATSASSTPKRAKPTPAKPTVSKPAAAAKDPTAKPTTSNKPATTVTPASPPPPTSPTASDSGDLILDNPSPPPTTISNTHHHHHHHHPSSMAKALNGHLSAARNSPAYGSGAGGGPISLHSAASSPASWGGSPAVERQDEGPTEFVFGDEEEDGEEEVVLGGGGEAGGGGGDGGEEPDAEEEEVVDDDDDMEKQLAAALGAEDEAPLPVEAPVVAEESEESEEE